MGRRPGRRTSVPGPSARSVLGCASSERPHPPGKAPRDSFTNLCSTPCSRSRSRGWRTRRSPSCSTSATATLTQTYCWATPSIYAFRARASGLPHHARRALARVLPVHSQGRLPGRRLREPTRTSTSTPPTAYPCSATAKSRHHLPGSRRRLDPQAHVQLGRYSRAGASCTR